MTANAYDRQEAIDESAQRLLEEVSLTLPGQRMVTTTDIFIRAAQELARAAFAGEPDYLLEEQVDHELAAIY